MFVLNHIGYVVCVNIYLQLYTNNHKVLKNNYICFAKPIYLSYNWICLTKKNVLSKLPWFT